MNGATRNRVIEHAVDGADQRADEDADQNDDGDREEQRAARQAQPLNSSPPATMLASPAIEPTDRSMPPVRMTNVRRWPGSR